MVTVFFISLILLPITCKLQIYSLMFFNMNYNYDKMPLLINHAEIYDDLF